MDFSVMDEHRDAEQHRKQHDSCSTAQAHEKTQAHAQVQEKTRTHAQAQAEQETSVAGDSNGDEEQIEKLQKLQRIVEKLQKQIVQRSKTSQIAS